MARRRRSWRAIPRLASTPPARQGCGPTDFAWHHQLLARRRWPSSDVVARPLCDGLLCLASLVQALLRGRQKGHAWCVAPRVLLVQVADPPVHRRDEAVVVAGAIGRPAEVTPDDTRGAADLVDEPLLPINIDLHPRQRPCL